MSAAPQPARAPEPSTARSIRLRGITGLLPGVLLLLIVALLVAPTGALSGFHPLFPGPASLPSARTTGTSAVGPTFTTMAPSGGGFGRSHLTATLTPGDFAQASGGGVGAPSAVPEMGVPATMGSSSVPSSRSTEAAPTGLSGPSAAVPSTSTSINGRPQMLSWGPYGWSGMNSLSSQWVPPDPVVAVGPTNVMQVVNSNLEIWNKDGTGASGVDPLTTFLPSGNSQLGDVQVLYDNMTHRWFMTVDDFTYGTVWICTSTSYSPWGAWYLLNLSIAPAGDYFDRPILGVSDYVLGIGGNVWTNGGSFVNAEWFVINKTMLENNAGYYWWFWTNPSYYALHPAADWTNATAGSPGTQIFVSTNSGSTPIMIGRETGGASASVPALSLVNYAHAALTGPPDAVQEGTNAPYVSVALSGTQEMNAVWQKGLLWFDFDIGCTPAGDSQLRSCVEYIEFNTVTNTILNDITQDQSGFYVYYPAIATDAYGDAALAVGYSGSTVYPSLTVLGRNYTYTGGSEFWNYVAVGASQDAYGSCTAAPNVCRYGDYFGAAPDPSQPGTIWIEGEWETTGAIWSTYIQSVHVNPASVPNAFWNQTSVQTDVGQTLMLNFTDTDSQCAGAQIGFCNVHFNWGDGSYFSDVCDGSVQTWRPPNTWFDLWNVSHVYTATGNYTVGGANAYLDAFGQNPCSAGSYRGEGSMPPVAVQVNRDPVAGNPVPSATSLDVGQTVTFATPPMYGGTAPVKTYLWYETSASFGCGLVAGGISCTPTAAGSYQAGIAMTDSVGMTSGVSYSVSVTVIAAPTGTLAWSPTVIDLGQSSTVTVTPSGGSGGNSYSWSQSSSSLGCSFANAVSVVCTPTAAGSFTASVDVTDSNGGSSGTLTSPSLTVDPAVSTTAPTGSPGSADLGQSVTFSTTASGGSGSYTSYSWSPSSSSLGCSASTTASISCTPTAAGSYTISVTVTDSNGGTGSATSASYTVYADPTIVAPTANVTSADVGQGVIFTASASGGSGGFTYAWSGLPTGCVGGTGATVTCTVSAAGTASVTVSATDSNGQGTGTSTALSFTVYGDPTTTTPTGTPSTAEVGQTVSFSTTASGGSGGYAYYWSGLPTGCTTSNADPLSCVPGGAGTFSVIVTVIDSNGFPYTSSLLSYSVVAGPSVTTPTASPSTVDVGQSVTFSASASGGSTGYTYAWSGLPTGCSGGSTGSTVCVPTGAGTFHVGVNVTDSLGGKAASGLLTYVVSAQPTVSAPTATPASVDVGQTTSIAVVVTGGASPYAYAWSGLPTGCSGTAATVSCTPSAAGTSTINVQVRDANGGSATSATLSLTVYALPSLSAPTASPNPGTVGASMSLSTTLTGGAPSDTYAWTGLPTGCTNANAATITCSPTAAGTFTVKASVTDGNGGSTTSAATVVTVNTASGGSPTVSLTASPSTVAIGSATTLTGSVSGGTSPYSYAWTGLPAGCSSSNTATLSCTPTAAGSFTITLTVTDAQAKTGQGTASLTVTSSSSGSPTVSVSANPASVVVNHATALTGIVSGGTTPYTYAWAGLPQGCTSQNSATLTCIPTATGSFPVTLTVTDANGKHGQASVTLTVTTSSGGGGQNQSTGGQTSLLSNPFVLIGILAVIIAVAVLALLLRRKKPSPAPSGEAPPPPSEPAPPPATAPSPPAGGAPETPPTPPPPPA